MASKEVFTEKFVQTIQKPKEDRSEYDVDYLCLVLKKLSEFQTFDVQALKNLLDLVSFESVPANSVLYRPGEMSTCWYYIVNGNVTISNMYFYTSGCSFGQCVDTNMRTDRCVADEDTQLLRIDYSEKEMERFVRRSSKGGGASSLTNSMEARTTLSVDRERTSSLNKMASLSDSELRKDDDDNKPKWKMTVQSSLNGEESDGGDWTLNKRAQSYDSDHFRFDESALKTLSASNDSLNRAVEDDPIHLGDEEVSTTPCDDGTSEVKLRDRRKVEHRKSAPPTHNRSMRDSVGSLDYLSETQVDLDSDDEESVQSESSSSMDSVYEVLNKPPGERTEEDIDRVMDVLQFMPAFVNLTSNIREALFKVLLLTLYSDEGNVVLDNGDEVDKWFVVLHGQLRLVRDSDNDKYYHIGESFGVSASLKVLPHRGKLITATKDCQVCYVSAEDYGSVLAQGEENLRRIEEEGEVVAVLEKRAVSAKREGYFVIQATPDKLLDYLLEEGVDDFYHCDFLLTYRSFLSTPQPIVDKIKNIWEDAAPQQRERIIMIILNWVSEHYSDFDCVTEMTEFLEWFEQMLLVDGKVGEKRMLDEAIIRNAKTRSINLDREGVNTPLDFRVVGGWELAQPVYVSDVDPNSRAESAGLRRGDQILLINDTKCDQRELRDVMNILQKNYKLEIMVKSNLPRFKQFMSDPAPSSVDHVILTSSTSSSSSTSSTTTPPSTVPTTNVTPPLSSSHPNILRSNSTSASTSSKVSPVLPSKAAISRDSPKHKKKTPSIFKPIVKTLSKSSMDRFKSRLRNSGSLSVDSATGGDSPTGPLKARKKLGARKNSEENLLDDHEPKGNLRSVNSAEDLHNLEKSQKRSNRISRTQVVDAVVKVYVLDHSSKYFDVTSSTTVADIISRGVKDFFPDRFVASPADEFCLCMVTVQTRSGPIRNSVLPGHLTELAKFIGLESRYYLKERAFHGTLVQDEEAERIVKESRQWENILNLKPLQVAEELTRNDSEVFCSIAPSEFIADLWRDHNKAKKQHLIDFENIPNDEMYWVITTIVTETNTAIRAKLMKHFIKIARCCKTLKNFNTMFHILSGLSHGLVQRLKSSWEKVPHKYKKLMEDLIGYMNPFHNMSKYRELQRSTKPPLIPFFPIIKKDLTFLYDGNDSKVDGLINFEKLRMLSKRIREVKAFCTQPIMPTPAEVDLSQLGMLNRTINSLHGSLRWKQRSPAHMISLTESALKRVYMHTRMSKMVCKHLSKRYVLQDESYLEKIIDSHEKLANTRRGNPPSPLGKGKKGVTDRTKKMVGSTTISPSPTTNSLGSDVSAPVDCLFTPTSNSLIVTSPHLREEVSPTRSSSVNSFTSTASAPPK